MHVYLIKNGLNLLICVLQVGDFSKEVLQSLGVPYGSQSSNSRSTFREPDSGISSARSTTTVPWTNNDQELSPELLQQQQQQLRQQHQVVEGDEEEHTV